MDEESTASGGGADAAGQPLVSAEDAGSTANEREQHQMSLEVGNSPKLAKRGAAVKELEKQPNGSFLASEATLQETLSPKPARSTRTSKVSKAEKKSPFEEYFCKSVQCSAQYRHVTLISKVALGKYFLTGWCNRQCNAGHP